MKGRLLVAFVLVILQACRPAKPGVKNVLSAVSEDAQVALFEKHIEPLTKQIPYRFEMPIGSPEFPVDKENPLSVDGVELGRWLFYETLLSRDKTMACGSCHLQKFGFADGQRHSPGVHGSNTGFNSMHLVNLAWHKAYFWDGRAKTLRDQALQPIENTRELDMTVSEVIARLKGHRVYPRFFGRVFGAEGITRSTLARALAQFMSTLVSFSAPLDEVRRVEIGIRKESDLPPELRPFLLQNMDPVTRETVNLCGSCHNGIKSGVKAYLSAIYGGTIFTNNGIPATRDDGSPVPVVKVPDLRNVTLTAPYMHDGRFADLDAVLDHYSTGVQPSPNLDPLLKDEQGRAKKLRISGDSRVKILKYLALMTDDAFVRNPKFADPFRKPVY